MGYAVRYSRAAEKQFDDLPQSMRERIAPAIDALAEQPRPPGVVKMKGGEDRWRIRVGDYRVVYEIRDAVLLVLVVRIGHRKDVYE
jgi:mRNA interferase RelE/StbE